MVVKVTLFVLAVLIAAIWIIVELKRLRHKLFAIFLIALVLFTYISFTITLRGQDIDYTTISGVMEAGKLYFSWLGFVFGNLKTMTIHAIQMDWKGNQTAEWQLGWIGEKTKQ